MKITDEQLVQAVQEYRESVGNLHGPQSLGELGQFLAAQGVVDEPMHRAPLHYRVWSLIRRGYLAVSNGTHHRLFTPGLYVTDAGREFAKGSNG